MRKSIGIMPGASNWLLFWYLYLMQAAQRMEIQGVENQKSGCQNPCILNIFYGEIMHFFITNSKYSKLRAAVRARSLFRYVFWWSTAILGIPYRTMQILGDLLRTIHHKSIENMRKSIGIMPWASSWLLFWYVYLMQAAQSIEIQGVENRKAGCQNPCILNIF